MRTMLLRHANRVLLLRNSSSSSSTVDYDLVVIGGGSAGLACSKTASSLGAKVALVDAVEPSPEGTTWGIGGTCANVGCIPKKLFHQATIVGREVEHAQKYGWKGVERPSVVDWNTLSKVVNDRIKANNWVYRVQLNQRGVKYYNAFARFIDHNTLEIEGVDKKKTKSILRAPHIVIGAGLRPNYPNVPGAEYGITSDDIFTLPNPPGKTLVVGGSYVALEIAGMLKDLGFPVDLMIRSRPLKSFDRDMVDHVMRNLEAHGVNVRLRQQLVSVEKDGQRKQVTFMAGEATRHEEKDVYDTIVWAIGRTPRLVNLNLEAVNVKTSAVYGRILADEYDRTTAAGVYALGDVVEGRPELTPAAIRSGFLLANRLFGGSIELTKYDKVFHAFFTPYEFIVPQDPDGANCYAKVICMRNEPRTVLGIHIVGPNAAEIMQGYAVAFKKGITFDDLTSTVAIHPCSSEEIVKMSVSKRSGLDPKVAGCCG